jgi:hypothetical protein
MSAPRTVDITAHVQHGRLYLSCRSVEAIEAVSAMFPAAPWIRDCDGSGPYCATDVRVDPAPIVWVAPLESEAT